MVLLDQLEFESFLQWLRTTSVASICSPISKLGVLLDYPYQPYMTEGVNERGWLCFQDEGDPEHRECDELIAFIFKAQYVNYCERFLT